MNRIPPFTEDSRLIQWSDSCAEEGAHRPLGYEDGIVAESEREAWWLLPACLIAMGAAFVASMYWPCWFSC